MRRFPAFLFLLLALPVFASPSCCGDATYPADIIGYVTAGQIRDAGEDGLPVSALHARQRQKLSRTGPGTRIQFFKKETGRYGVQLIAPPQVEEIGR